LILAGCGGSGAKSKFGNFPGSGKARLTLDSVQWGRLVDVLDQNGVLVEKDALIRDSLQSDGIQFLLSKNPVTGSATLTILQDVGTPLFQSLLQSAKSGRAAVVTKGPSDPPTFSRVPRNSALLLQFSELVDPATVNRDTIQFLVGGRVQELRYIIKNGVVGADGQPKGIVIVDPVISKFEEEKFGLPENPLGFLASFDNVQPNLILKIPTEVDPLFGQNQVLTNLAGTRTLTALASDPVELSPGLKTIVLRAMRSGNGSGSDPFNGFLFDQGRPNLVTEQGVDLLQVSASGNLRSIIYRISSAACRGITPKVGDVFQVGDAVGLVVTVTDKSNPESYRVDLALLSGDIPLGVFQPGQLPGNLTSIYTGEDSQLQLCWLKFFPVPENPPAGGVDPFASVAVTFDEPMDSATVRALDSMVLTSFELAGAVPDDDPVRPFGFPDPESVEAYINRQLGFSRGGQSGRILLGSVDSSPDFRTFTLTPAAGLTDTQRDGEVHFALALRDGAEGILDLAGQQVNFGSFVAGNENQALAITLAGDPSTWPADRYFALRMNSLDEDGDGAVDYRGQFFFDPGVLKPRSLEHISLLADSSNSFVGRRIAFGQGLLTPLAPAGAVLMTSWRYIDLGLGLLNPPEYNLDVEGMDWAPFGGTVFDDTFPRVSIALAHGKKFPDEFIDPGSGYPSFPDSGLQRGPNVFNDSILGFPTINEKIVIDRDFSISQNQVFTASSGTAMYPWPAFTSTYTWRDTSILPKPPFFGGAGGNGVPPTVVGAPVVFPKGKVPSIGLPLLARFRVFPRGKFFGTNGFQVQIMVASSALPAFRVFSAGGKDGAGTWHQVVPDVAPDGVKPTGGFNSVNGTKTKGFGPELYWEQIDFVLRISRVFTHWFAFDDPGISTGKLKTISNITVEPSIENQAPGTQVLVEFRGSARVDETGCNPNNGRLGPLTDTSDPFDDYGEFVGTCGSVATPGPWTKNFASFIGQFKYFQIRFTFIANVPGDLTPELDAFGFAWTPDPNQ